MSANEAAVLVEVAQRSFLSHARASATGMDGGKTRGVPKSFPMRRPLAVDFSRARERMVDVQIAQRGVRDPLVLDAMRRVPREAFVEPWFEQFAYEDGALPIPEKQSISQPYIVALMIETTEVMPGARVLEVGAGSGYAAAVMSRIAERVYAIERHRSLGEVARRRFESLGYGNIYLRVGDGTRGWPDAAPFDAILVSAGGRDVPQALKEQLAVGGRLVMPVGEVKCGQTLLRLTRTSATGYAVEGFGLVAFVPLIGESPTQQDPGEAGQPGRHAVDDFRGRGGRLQPTADVRRRG